MLKPSELKLDGKFRDIAEHKKLLTSKISALKNKKLVRVLMAIMESSSGRTIDITDISHTEINEIKNYFSECVAPILLYRTTSEMKKAQCFYSSSQTESVYDFIIKYGNKKYLFSNKQLRGATNTLKPSDVVKFVTDDKVLYQKWGKSKVFKVFKTLDESNVISGPIKAIRDCYLSYVSPVTKADLDKVISQMTKNDVIIENVPKSIMNMIKKDEVAYEHYNEKGVVSGTMINFIFEKILVDISRNDDDYNEMFLDVTKNNVYFFKFDLSNKGVLKYEVSDPEKSRKKAALRSKQGVERRSSKGLLKLDKLGFQP